VSHWLLALLILAAPLSGKDKTKKPPAPTATVAGTVFRTPGFALSGIEVTVTPEKFEVAGVKFTKQHAVTNTRGEWAVRVPAVPMEYQVSVKPTEFEAQAKSVSIEGEQRKEINFLLEPKAGK
jgi:hypothetical protein